MAKIERKFIPHINDLSQNVIWEGNNGEKWIVEQGITSKKSIEVKLVPIPLKEEILTNEIIKE